MRNLKVKKISDRLINRINRLASLNLSQDEIAYELCISQGTVSKYANIRQTKEDRLEANSEKSVCNQ